MLYIKVMFSNLNVKLKESIMIVRAKNWENDSFTRIIKPSFTGK